MDDAVRATESAADETRLAVLQRMIAEIGGPIGQAGRRSCALGESGAAGEASGLLDEIDRTVMARRLVFRNERGETAALEVRNRRLLGVDFSGDQDRSRSGRPAVGDLLTYAGAGDLAALKEALEAFCRGGALRVSIEAPRREAGIEETGVSVTMLHRALRATNAMPEPASAEDGFARLQRLCDACAPLSAAWAIAAGDGKPVGQGEAVLVRRLTDAINVYRQRLGSSRPNGPGALLLSAALPAIGSVGLFDDEAATAAVAVLPDKEGTVLALWSDRYLAGE